MADQLLNVVRFTGLVVGVPTPLPHGLNVGGTALVPDKVTASAGGLTIAADDTNVTVTRPTTSDPDAVDVLVEHWHSFLRVFGARDQFQPANLVPQPFFAAGGGPNLLPLDNTWTGQNAFAQGNGDFTFDAGQDGGVIVGYAQYANAGNPATLRMGSPYGAQVQTLSAYATTSGTGGQSSTIRAQAPGALLSGFSATPAGAYAHVQEIYTSGYAYGAIGGGYVRNYGAAGTGRIRVYGQAAFVLGNVAKSGAGTHLVSGPYPSTFVMGRLFGTGTHTLYGGASAAFVQGQCSGAGASTIRAAANGAWATGVASGGADIYALGVASFARGASSGAGVRIEASGVGAFAMGNASSYGLYAYANGSFAFGDADTANIVANAVNAAQFGPGTNTLADSFQVGAAGLRFKGTAGAPGAPQDGDFWVSGGNVYVRSGGATQNLTNVP